MSHCLDDDTWSALIDGTLSEPAIAIVDAHLDRCADCRDLFGELAKSSDAPVGTDDAPVDLPRPARRVGRYVLGAVIGEGGMGVVHEAYDPQLRRRVAIKLVRPDAGMSEAGEDRLLAEARALARLSHPNVVQVYDAGIADEQVFLCMEHVEGRTMRRWLASERGASEPRWRELTSAFAAAGRGLAAAHAAGIMHRDFKPENVLLAADGRVLVTDFGLARDTATAVRLHAPCGLARAASSMLAGTPAYMSPEQLEGRPVDARTDQFSFCIALAEALCRRDRSASPPADGDHRVELLLDGLRARRIPARMIQAVRRGLERDPDRRFPTMEPLLVELARALQRRHAAVVTGALALVVAAIVADAAVTGARPHDPAAFCTASDPPGAVLTAEVRSAMRAALARTAASEDAWQRVDRRLATVAQQWTAARNEICREPAPADAPRREARTLATQCLEDRLYELRAFVSLVRGADPPTAAKAVELSLQVGTPRRCRRELPLDPMARAVYDRLQRDLVELELRVASGRWAEGLELARAGLPAVRALRMTSLEAEWLFLRGDLERGASDLVNAEASLLEAVAAADRAGRDDLRVRCLAGLASIALIRDRPDEAARWSAQADAAMERSAPTPIAEAALRNLQAYIEIQHGRGEKALALAQRALALWQRANHPHVAVGHHTTAISLNELGRLDEAVAHEREALARWERDLGPDHPNTGTALLSVGLAEHRGGHHRAAIASLERALAIFDRTGTNGGIPRVLLALAITYRRAAQPERARAAIDRCLSISAASLGLQSSVTIGCRVMFGKLAFSDGEITPAIAAFEQALAALDPVLKAHVGRAALAEASFGLAQALWQRATSGDRPRALSLARMAAAAYADGSVRDDDERDEIARWLAARQASL